MTLAALALFAFLAVYTCIMGWACYEMLTMPPDGECWGSVGEVESEGG